MDAINAVQQYLISSFFGFIVCLVLFGVCLGQALFYYRTYVEDRRALKYLVIVLLFLDLIHMACLGAVTFETFIFGRISELSTLQSRTLTPFTISVGITYCIAFTAQIFYAVRISKLGDRAKLIPGIITLLALFQLISGVGLISQVGSAGQLQALYTKRAKTWGFMELVSVASCDSLITISLVYWLNSRRSGMEHSETLINKLIFYSLNLGLLASVMAIICFILYLSLWESSIFQAFYYPISECYVNSLLATLNARTSLRKHLRNEHTVDFAAQMKDRTGPGASEIVESPVSPATPEAQGIGVAI